MVSILTVVTYRKKKNLLLLQDTKLQHTELSASSRHGSKSSFSAENLLLFQETYLASSRHEIFFFFKIEILLLLQHAGFTFSTHRFFILLSTQNMLLQDTYLASSGHQIFFLNVEILLLLQHTEFVQTHRICFFNTQNLFLCSGYKTLFSHERRMPYCVMVKEVLSSTSLGEPPYHSPFPNLTVRQTSQKQTPQNSLSSWLLLSFL